MSKAYNRSFSKNRETRDKVFSTRMHNAIEKKKLYEHLHVSTFKDKR